jgi:hypothetical protein
MKMVCPCCGLTGTAEAELFARKVRCPGCRGIFRITEAVVVDFPAKDHGVIERSFPGAAQDNEHRREDASLHGTGDGSAGGAAQCGEQAVCSRCGFTLSYSFIKMIDSLLVCTACSG